MFSNNNEQNALGISQPPSVVTVNERRPATTKKTYAFNESEGERDEVERCKE